MTKAIIRKLNTIATEDFKKAKAMLDGINLIHGTKFGWLNRRVVFFEEPDASTAIKYAHAHDALAYAEE